MASTASSDAVLEPFVEIFSPVPPMQTGPADYLDKALERVCAVPGCAARIKIAIDPDLIPAGARPPHSIHGARVEDYRSFSRNVPTGRSRIFFLANNNHHAYVYSTLERQSSMAGGRVISVVHDVSAFMLHRYRLENGNHQLSEADVVAAAYPQYGSATSRYVRARQDDIMPDIFEYVTHSQYAALANSHEIWVHSLFAIAKLTCESDIPARQLPTIRLCAPPRLDELPFDKPAPVANRFFIGCFGWITPAKRIESVLRGLSLALDRLPAEARRQIELMIVGRKPPGDLFDPHEVATAYDVSDAVRMIEYPDNDEFLYLQASCQLIFNLRYPSCGESSGTLLSAGCTGAQLATSRYQTFNEVSPECRKVTTLHPLDDWEIASVICEAYDTWRRGEAAAPTLRSTDSSPCPVEKLLLYEIISRSNAARLQASS